MNYVELFKNDKAYTGILEIASGGFGIVYKATRVDSGEVVAVKVIQIDHKYLNEDKSSMKKEIELLSTMSHKNIIKFFTEISPVVGLFSSLLKVVISVAFSSKGAV